MRWLDGPARFERVLTLLHRLEELVAAVTRDEELSESERAAVEARYLRLRDSIVLEAEREQQRLIDAALRR